MAVDPFDKYLCKDTESLKTVDADKNICDFSHKDFQEYNAPLGELLKEYITLFSVYRIFRGKKWKTKEELIRKILNNSQIIIWYKKDGDII